MVTCVRPQVPAFNPRECDTTDIPIGLIPAREVPSCAYLEEPADALIKSLQFDVIAPTITAPAFGCSVPESTSSTTAGDFSVELEAKAGVDPCLQTFDLTAQAPNFVLNPDGFPPCGALEVEEPTIETAPAGGGMEITSNVEEDGDYGCDRAIDITFTMPDFVIDPVGAPPCGGLDANPPTYLLHPDKGFEVATDVISTGPTGCDRFLKLTVALPDYLLDPSAATPCTLETSIGDQPGDGWEVTAEVLADTGCEWDLKIDMGVPTLAASLGNYSNWYGVLYADMSGAQISSLLSKMSPSQWDDSGVCTASCAGGGGGGGIPGKVLSKVAGQDGVYLVELYENGADRGSTGTVEVKQMQIDVDETIPADTWAIIVSLSRDVEPPTVPATTETVYYMQVPIWLAPPLV